MDGEPPVVKCAFCFQALDTFEIRIPFTAEEDIVFVNCARCERMIYARPVSRLVEAARWKVAS